MLWHSCHIRQFSTFLLHLAINFSKSTKKILALTSKRIKFWQIIQTKIGNIYRVNYSQNLIPIYFPIEVAALWSNNCMPKDLCVCLKCIQHTKIHFNRNDDNFVYSLFIYFIFLHHYTFFFILNSFIIFLLLLYIYFINNSSFFK